MSIVCYTGCLKESSTGSYRPSAKGDDVPGLVTGLEKHEETR